MNHPGLKHPVKSLLAAVRFLTIFPVPRSSDDETDYFEGALFYFTITGLLVGFIGAGIAVAISSSVPSLVLGVLLALYLSLVSGFLHLDGLADSSDGLLSARPGPQCLEIMKDSRVGVMGAAVICFVVLLKSASISALDDHELFPVLLLVPAGGRTAIVMMMTFLPYARGESGLGHHFYSGMNRWTLVVSASIFILACLLWLPQKAVLICFTLGVTTLIFSRICKKKIGGATGDTLGALCELTETTLLITLCL